MSDNQNDRTVATATTTAPAAMTPLQRALLERIQPLTTAEKTGLDAAEQENERRAEGLISRLTALLAEIEGERETAPPMVATADGIYALHYDEFPDLLNPALTHSDPGAFARALYHPDVLAGRCENDSYGLALKVAAVFEKAAASDYRGRTAAVLMLAAALVASRVLYPEDHAALKAHQGDGSALIRPESTALLAAEG